MPIHDFRFSKTIVAAMLALAALATCLLACDQNSDAVTASRSLLNEIRSRGKLIVLTTNLPTTYYYDRDNQLAGPEYDMTQAFANSMQIDVEYKVYDSTKALLAALRAREGDIAAAGLTVNVHRKKEFDYGPVYQSLNEYLVCHRSVKAVNDTEDLKALEIVVAADSSYIESIKAYPEIRWTAEDVLNTAKLLEQVADRKIQCTISDSTLYSIERRYHTELQDKYTLAEASELAWMLNKNSDKLKQAINTWFRAYKKSDDLARVMDKYYGFVEIFDYVDTHKLLKRAKTRLPKYKKHFIDAASKNGISPSLLAAQSYQESHWNSKAKSPTGVRGIMMLTQPVAKSLGVSSRLDAKENIYAGAKFQAKMKQIVEHVEEPDRTWLALAAYNVGRGHFRDAQALAIELDRDPDRWHEMKQVLPLLSEKKYYKNLKYGYARGDEPVSYVTRIRGYDELLRRFFN